MTLAGHPAVDYVERTAPRRKVHFAVRYMAADSYVREYAENLSRGGLFVAGADNLEPFQRVEVELDLPGSGLLTVEAEVVHILDRETAERTGRTAGAGLSICSGPPGFHAALTDYLLRIDQRGVSMVFVDDHAMARVLGAAGYRVTVWLDPDTIVAALDACADTVVGLVCAGAEVDRYQSALASVGRGDLVAGVGQAGDVDGLLAELDRRILSRSEVYAVGAYL